MTTARNLELISNVRDPASTHSLFGVLNYTSTPGGGRHITLSYITKWRGTVPWWANS